MESMTWHVRRQKLERDLDVQLNRGNIIETMTESKSKYMAIHNFIKGVLQKKEEEEESFASKEPAHD